MLGYLIIALSLVLFVQAKNVYPQLLLGRLFFSIGGAAASTMVTAILPAIAAGGSPMWSSQKVEDPQDAEGPSQHHGARNAPIERVVRNHADSLSSDTTITPSRLQRQQNPSNAQSQSPSVPPKEKTEPSTSRVAGFVGLSTGAGALIALTVFLPLPARFQKAGISPGQALQDSYYIVAAVALVLSLLSYCGLSGLAGEASKGFLTAFRPFKSDSPATGPTVKPFWVRFGKAFALGFRHPKVGLGYVGGFVARASSVGISLFIPLAINAQFRVAGLCNVDATDAPAGLPDIKRRCPRAYTLSAELTGVSQLMALLAAPAFGYLMSKFGRRYIPLVIGAITGIGGYVIFGTSVQRRRESVNGSALDFVAMALIGISQIAAIVCSLGILSDGVLQHNELSTRLPEREHRDAGAVEEDSSTDEQAALLGNQHNTEGTATDLKGSVAGLYSLYGGAGILILTKVGGALFDSLSFGSPFFIMAIFNGILLAACVVANFIRIPSPQIVAP